MALWLHAAAVLGALWWPRAETGTAAGQHTRAPAVVMLWQPTPAMVGQAPTPHHVAPITPQVAPTPAPPAAVATAPPMPVQTPHVLKVSNTADAATVEVATSTLLTLPSLPSADPLTTTSPPHSASTNPPGPLPAAQPPAESALTHARADHQRCPPAGHPPALRERGIEGLVQLRVRVDSQGQPSQVQLLASSGWRLFDEAALAMARGCRFHPARQADHAVDSWVEFPVRFALQG
jgi:protein TonB